MATINVTTSQNLTAVTYAQDDIINVLDGVTLTINSQWSIKPRLIQALGTGRIEDSNASTTVPQVRDFYMQNNSNAGGFLIQQNGVLQTRGDWITVGTSTGTNNQVLFSANNIGGVAIDYPTMIQVETGNGTDEWEIWNAIPEDVSGGLVNSQGFNTPNITAGTVAVGAGGLVTGTGTNFLTTQVGLPFKLPGIARDFVVGTFSSATSITLQELDGSTYTGGAVTAGSSYILRAGSLINLAQVGNSEVGKVLFFNPVTTAVRMGNDTNGTKIPSGARVRVPNIHYNSAIQQTTLATAISGTGAQNFTLTTAIGSTAPGIYSATGLVGTLLLINGSNVERIFYSSRAGTSVSSTGMVRGAHGTTAQTFPIGTTVYWIPANSTNNNAQINASPSGTIDMQICSLGLRMITGFSAFASLTISDFGYANLFNAGNCAGNFDIDRLSGLGIGYQNPNINGGLTAQFSALLGIGNIRNVSVTNNLPGGANSYSNINIGNVQGLIFCNNLRSRHWGRTTNAGGGALIGVSLQTVKCATPITGIYAAGSSVRWNAIDNLDTSEIFMSALPNANTLGTGDTFIPIFVVGITDSTIRGMQLWGGGKSTRASLISIDQASVDVVFHNKNYPAFDGGLQLNSIISDLGLDTIVAHISISNPRITTSSSVLPGTMAFNRGGFHRMLLIDSITSTASASGANAKGGLGLDVIAGPHRQFQTTATNTIIPNLADVQPIVVMSNLAKTVGSVYVGSFSSQSLFNMYTFTGGTYLDNLGRIYYPTTGDSAIIKSVFPLRGITNFTGTAFDFNYNLSPGSNTVPAGTTLEFRMTNWGTANTGAWTAFVNNASLETARAGLTGYSSSVGIDLQFRITGTTDVAGRYLMSIKLPVTIDSSYNPPVSETQVGISGAQTNTLLAGYLNADPNNPELQGSLTMAGSVGSIPMPYDYDNIPVDYRLIARLQGWTFIDITGIYVKDDISVPVTQLQVVDLNSTPLYTSGVTGVTIDHDAETITVSASRSAKQIWSAVQDNLCLLANLTKADPFTTSNGSSFVSTYDLIVTGAITSGNIVGDVILSGSLSSGVNITGNVSQTTAINLTGVSITGNLTYNDNVTKSITLTSTSITGTYSNSGTGIITVINTNSTFTAGANIVTYKPVSFAYNLDGGSILIKRPDNSVLGFFNSDGVVNFTNLSQQGTYTVRVPKFGKQTILSSFVVDTTAGTAISTFNASFITDTFVDDTLANVLLYTELNDVQKAYNYSSYYRTLQEGIDISGIISKQFTSLTVNAPVEIKNTTLVNSKLIYWDGTTVFIKSSVFSGTQTVYVSGNFTLTGTTLGDDIKIRATNIDSEIIATGYLPIRYYATSSDRRTDTNCFLIQTVNVYRFKYNTGGLTGTVYILSGTAEAKKDVIIVNGTTIISLDISDKVDLVNTNLQKVNRNVIKASKIIPAKETF